MRLVCSFFMMSFFALAGMCHGSVVFQLDARKNVSVSTDGSNVVWTALQGMRVAGAKDEWGKVGDGVSNVKGALAGPLVFAEGSVDGDAVMKSAVLVVRTAPSLRARETLFCGELVFRLAGEPENKSDGNLAAGFEQDGNVNNLALWRVDGVEGAGLESGRVQLVEVVFGRGMKLSEVALGSDWGRREWRRAFGGALCEVVVFDDEPSESVLTATRHYLNLKWSLGLELPKSTASQRSEAGAQGVNLGSIFATIFMVK